MMVIGVSVDESADDATNRALALRATFPVVLDPHMTLAARYRVAQIPLTFVVDHGGTVRWVGRDPADCRRAVEHVLHEGSDAGGAAADDKPWAAPGAPNPG